MPTNSKYKERWEEEDDGSNGEKIGKWFHKANDYQAKCKLCNKEFSIAMQGISAIKRNANFS